MSNFKLTLESKENGKTIYNAGIVQNIVALAVAEVEGTVPMQKKNGIALYIEKDGVYVNVSVVVKYGYNIPELAYRIQQAVKQSVENMTKYKIAEVDVHIQDVVFENATPAEPEKETEEENVGIKQQKENNENNEK